jgi:hypothetical protein
MRAALAQSVSAPRRTAEGVLARIRMSSAVRQSST